MEVSNIKKSFIFTILFIIFTFFANAYAGSDLYDKFLIELKEFETAQQSAQVERYKYASAEYAIQVMIENNDMVGLKLMSQHYMWDAIRTIGFGGILQIAAEVKNLEAFTFILSNKDYIKAVTTDSYMYTDLINTQNFLQQQVQKDNDKVYMEMKKLLDNFIKKYPAVKN
ncbi:hypothetical protein [uncultured Clostridium sp.]|uniref:hypothetical protein n=1 Tax=uncultured Clostridium sp. TaxID=59620 RepID=UPI00262FBCBA|nr:hypothetical protein [uncultured Clostridium sp.]